MNFYSEDIIKHIIDTEAIENIIDQIDIFKETAKYLFQRYSFQTIHYKYTQHLLRDGHIQYAFYCMDNEFSIYNCPTMMIYRKYLEQDSDEIRYYILLICTKFQFRNQGYASKLIANFVEHLKGKKSKTGDTRKIKIVLSSVEEAVLFYESIGFRWTRDTLKDHGILLQYEKFQEEKEYFIMELCID